MTKQKTAFVTGGAEGIGAAVSHSLGLDGYKIYFCDINQDKGISREKILKNAGLDATFLYADVGDSQKMREIGNYLLESGVALDLLVNNAGVADPIMVFPTEDLSRWKRVLETNLYGAFFTANFLLPLMKEGSSIINISSTRAYQSEKYTLPYSASKGGVYALTHALAITLSTRRIRVNSISPGWIDTSQWHIPPSTTDYSALDHEQHPSGRIGKAEDVANLVLFLASDKGSWINAEDIVIDGGMSKRMIYFDREVLEEALTLLTGDLEGSKSLLEEAYKKRKLGEE